MKKQQLGLGPKLEQPKSEADVYRSMADDGSGGSSSLLAASRAMSGGGMLNWKPHDDSALVEGVLQQVASLTSAGKKSNDVATNTTDDDDDLTSMNSRVPSALSNLSLGSTISSSSAASMTENNHYLSDLGNN